MKYFPLTILLFVFLYSCNAPMDSENDNNEQANYQEHIKKLNKVIREERAEKNEFKAYIEESLPMLTYNNGLLYNSIINSSENEKVTKAGNIYRNNFEVMYKFIDFLEADIFQKSLVDNANSKIIAAIKELKYENKQIPLKFYGKEESGISRLLKEDDYKFLSNKNILKQGKQLIFELRFKVAIYEATLLKLIFNELKTKIPYNDFSILHQAEQDIVKIGDTYKSQIYLGSIIRGEKVKYFVNDEILPQKDGVALFSAKASEVGKKELKLTALIRNPLTSKDEKVTKSLTYEVVD